MMRRCCNLQNNVVTMTVFCSVNASVCKYFLSTIPAAVARFFTKFGAAILLLLILSGKLHEEHLIASVSDCINYPGIISGSSLFLFISLWAPSLSWSQLATCFTSKRKSSWRLPEIWTKLLFWAVACYTEACILQVVVPLPFMASLSCYLFENLHIAKPLLHCIGWFTACCWFLWYMP